MAGTRLAVFIANTVLLGSLAAPALARPAVEIIAHRGASWDAPENTVEALKLAWEQGADVSEFDVHRSKDGQLVVIHDADTKRVAGVARKVADQTLDELRQLDVGKWKGGAIPGAKIPTLVEMLSAIPAGKRVFVEVKPGPEVVPALDRALHAAGLPPAQTPVISFHAEVIAVVKKARPDLEAYWIVKLKDREQERRTAADLIARANAIQADGLDLSASDVVDAEFVLALKAAGLKVYAWTVNDPAVARRLVDAGVDGITTDRPGWLRDRLAE